ncbi:MAG: hypothetical protein JWP52_3807, partial [Rhizobacter sp.]|nr:hypothetical protein [Rhizobacter sp.]
GPVLRQLAVWGWARGCPRPWVGSGGFEMPGWNMHAKAKYLKNTSDTPESTPFAIESMDCPAGPLKCGRPSTTDYLMNRIPPSILNTLQHREFYRHTPPPFTFTQSSMSASQPVVQSLNSGASSDNKTASTYPGKRPAKVPRHPPLVRTVSGTQPPNAAAAAQFAAITQEAARQTSHAAKPPFHPFHPGLTPEWIQRTQFSDRVKELLKGYVDWPVGTDQQAVNLIALRNAGFTMTPDDRKLGQSDKSRTPECHRIEVEHT